MWGLGSRGEADAAGCSCEVDAAWAWERDVYNSTRRECGRRTLIPPLQSVALADAKLVDPRAASASSPSPCGASSMAVTAMTRSAADSWEV